MVALGPVLHGHGGIDVGLGDGERYGGGGGAVIVGAGGHGGPGVIGAGVGGRGGGVVALLLVAVRPGHGAVARIAVHGAGHRLIAVGPAALGGGGLDVGPGDGELPAIAIHFGSGGVVVALGDGDAHIVGARVDGLRLDGAIGVAVILDGDGAGALHVGGGGHGGGLGLAVIHQVGGGGVSKVGGGQGPLGNGEVRGGGGGVIVPGGSHGGLHGVLAGIGGRGGLEIIAVLGGVGVGHGAAGGVAADGGLLGIFAVGPAFNGHGGGKVGLLDLHGHIGGGGVVLLAHIGAVPDMVGAGVGAGGQGGAPTAGGGGVGAGGVLHGALSGGAGGGEGLGLAGIGQVIGLRRGLHRRGGDGEGQLHAVAVRQGGDLQGAGRGGVEGVGPLQALIEDVLRAGQQVLKGGAVLPGLAVDAVLAAIGGLQGGGELVHRLGHGGGGGRLFALADLKLPILAEHQVGGGVVLALGHGNAHIVGAHVGGGGLDGAIGVAVILHGIVAHARHVGGGGHGGGLGAAVIGQVGGGGEGEITGGGGILADGEGEGHLGVRSQPQHQMEGALLLDIVVSQGSVVLQLLAGKNQPLLVRGDALFILDLGLDVLDGVGGLHVQGDGLAVQGLDKQLHGESLIHQQAHQQRCAEEVPQRLFQRALHVSHPLRSHRAYRAAMVSCISAPLRGVSSSRE